MDEKFWYKSYAPGVPKTLNYEKITISEALSRAAKNFPEHTALNYMGKRITFKELDGLVNQFARALRIWMSGRVIKSLSVCPISRR